MVYYWQRRFQALGLVGVTTQTRTDTPITMRVSVQAMMDVFQLLDNNPLLGHYQQLQGNLSRKGVVPIIRSHVPGVR